MITIVVGGQYGSEGKGKIISYMCRNDGYSVAVRCGGPNSGHTAFTDDGKKVILRQIPVGVVNDGTKLFLCAGCLIDKGILFDEIHQFDLEPARLKIDKNAVLIQEGYASDERDAQLRERIGSTCSGTGVAAARRLLRGTDVRLARDDPDIAPFLADVSTEIMNANARHENVIIEGTQGYGLSLYHATCYPFATGRDTTAAAFASEAGISPLVVKQVIMVLRTFPIRVGGNSGPMKDEIDWATVQHESGYPEEICEYTSVTKRLRRVARFDLDLARRAAMANMPTGIALIGLDYLHYKNLHVKNYDDIGPRTKEFVLNIEAELESPVILVGTGPSGTDIIDRREP